MPERSPAEVRSWLAQGPSLGELRAAYPADWAVVERQVDEVVSRGSVDELKAYVLQVSKPAPPPPRAERRRRGENALLTAEIRRVMTVEALKKVCLAAATGVASGKVRFNLVNGWLAQQVFFERGLVRKPVSMTRFRLVWPLLTQKRLLMPLVEPKGIYGFYSKPLVKRLAALIGDRPALEIAAGDGTLTRFLAGAGVDIVATDDKSWSHVVDFPDSVIEQDAVDALRERSPRAVVCSWPPPGNLFEAEVFKTRSVELYVMIGSRHAYASGNWSAYDEQDAFDYEEDEGLSRLVLPPEVEAAAYVFRRR